MDYLSLIALAGLAAIPAYLLWRISKALLAKVATSVACSAVQLAVVGLYVGWLYSSGSFFPKVAWLLLVAVVATAHGARCEGMRMRATLLPLLGSLFVCTLAMSLFLLFAVLRPVDALAARWFVPVAGLLMVASQKVASATLGAFFKGLDAGRQHYEFLLGNGATHFEAVLPYARKAMEEAFAPLLRKVSLSGLVVLPASLMGMLMGGMQPMEAAITLIAITVGGVSTAVLSTMLALYVADRQAFDIYGRLKNVLRN